MTLRANARTLCVRSGAPEPTQTSARSQFEERVERLDYGDAIVTVDVDVGAPVLLAALVTAEGRERLGLAVGTEVVVSFKATATRATNR